MLLHNHRAARSYSPCFSSLIAHDDIICTCTAVQPLQPIAILVCQSLKSHITPYPILFLVPDAVTVSAQRLLGRWCTPCPIAPYVHYSLSPENIIIAWAVSVNNVKGSFPKSSIHAASRELDAGIMGLFTEPWCTLIFLHVIATAIEWDNRNDTSSLRKSVLWLLAQKSCQLLLIHQSTPLSWPDTDMRSSMNNCRVTHASIVIVIWIHESGCLIE